MPADLYSISTLIVVLDSNPSAIHSTGMLKAVLLSVSGYENLFVFLLKFHEKKKRIDN